MGRTERPAQPSDPGRTGAALARLVVDNETSYALVIAYRSAVGPGGEVIVGRVGAGSRTGLAPVPADEPIILIARTADSRELELPPRTFPIRREWEWHIAADAPFRQVPSHGR